MRKLILSVLFVSSFFARSQPSTEVYLFEFDGNSLKNSINISNNDGYDNQPSFWPDAQSVLYARNVGGQTEIARYFISSGKTEIITNTLQGGEYSPTPIPSTNRISSVRLDTTGLQLLYSYDLSGNDQVLVKDLKIGYHAWISENEIVTFVLGDTITMQLVNARSGEARIVGKNIGRSLHKIPNSPQFSFVDKSNDIWQIQSMDLASRSTKVITEVIEGSEDYCWTNDGEILMGSGVEIYRFRKTDGWIKAWDLSELFSIQGNITRLTMSPNGKYLAVAIGD